MSRRTLLAGAGALALAAGSGLAWWRRTPAAPAEPIDPVWSLSFERPEGGTLDLSSFRGAPLLLNFWATWCPPCVKEMPMLDEFHRQNRASGWNVVGLAVDGPTSVRDFLQKQPVQFPIGFAGIQGTELSRSLGNTQGGLPFTVVFDRQGQMADKQLGALLPSHLEAWAKRFPA